MKQSNVQQFICTQKILIISCIIANVSRFIYTFWNFVYICIYNPILNRQNDPIVIIYWTGYPFSYIGCLLPMDCYWSARKEFRELQYTAPGLFSASFESKPQRGRAADQKPQHRTCPQSTTNMQSIHKLLKNDVRNKVMWVVLHMFSRFGSLGWIRIDLMLPIAVPFSAFITCYFSLLLLSTAFSEALVVRFRTHYYQKR